MSKEITAWVRGRGHPPLRGFHPKVKKVYSMSCSAASFSYTLKLFTLSPKLIKPLNMLILDPGVWIFEFSQINKDSQNSSPAFVIIFRHNLMQFLKGETFK